MKIAILDDYQDCVKDLDCFRLLDGHEVRVFNHSARGIGQLAIRLVPFDVLVLIGDRTAISKALLDKLPKLRLISQTGKATDHIDIEAATARRIAVAEGNDDPVATAELTWALVLAARRKIVQYASHLKDGLWQTASVLPGRNGIGNVLKGRTLGIWGYGEIGRIVAGYGKAFGMRVLVWDDTTGCAAALADGHALAQSKEALFEMSDVLSLHMRLAPATTGIVAGADLARMKPGALFVNTSCAQLVQEGALEQALREGRPGGAAVDVFDNEALAPASSLLRMENVLATPHLGDVERDAYEMRFTRAFQNVLDFAAGAPTNIVDRAVLAVREV